MGVRCCAMDLPPVYATRINEVITRQRNNAPAVAYARHVCVCVCRSMRVVRSASFADVLVRAALAGLMSVPLVLLLHCTGACVCVTNRSCSGNMNLLRLRPHSQVFVRYSFSMRLRGCCCCCCNFSPQLSHATKHSWYYQFPLCSW